MQLIKSLGLVGCISAALALLAVAFPSRVESQTLGEIKNYRVAEPYDSPNGSQIKSLLEGAKAKRLSDGQWLLTDAVVTMFRVTGERDIMVKAPQCLFDQASRMANSAGPLRAEMADGSFSIEGNGFRWQQTNSSLIISNQVRTIVRPKLIGPDSGKSGAEGPAMPEVLEVFSRSFDYTNNSGLAVYRDDARVVGTNLNLTSQTLTVDLPMTNRQVRSITAAGHVIIDYTNTAHLHATGENAVYETDTGLIRMSGHPTWQVDQRQGQGDELVIDRTNRVFEANGNAWLKMPLQNSGTFSFLSTSNPPTAGPSGATNRSIEVWSGRYEFRTNWAEFQENVRLNELLGEQARGMMSCGWMKAFFTGSNELETLMARTNVSIEADEKRMTGGMAIYNSTNGYLDLTEGPAWEAGTRKGKGDLLRVMTQHDEMRVRGNALLRLPANELATSGALGKPTVPSKAATQRAATQNADITCQEYTLRPELGIFEGSVHAKHPQMDWVCDRLTVRALPDNGKTLFAEGGVTFELADEKGQKVQGKGNNVVYTNCVTAAITNDIVYLRGNPATLEMTSMTVSNDLITLDRANNLMTAPGGAYAVKGTAKTDTNMFRLPKNGVKK